MLHRLVLQRDQKRDQAKSTCLKKCFLKFSKFFKQTKLIQDLYCNWLLQTDELVIVSPRPTQARSRLLGAFISHISSSSQPFSLKIYLQKYLSRNIFRLLLKLNSQDSSSPPLQGLLSPSLYLLRNFSQALYQSFKTENELRKIVRIPNQSVLFLLQSPSKLDLAVFLERSCLRNQLVLTKFERPFAISGKWHEYIVQQPTALRRRLRCFGRQCNAKFKNTSHVSRRRIAELLPKKMTKTARKQLEG